MTVRAHGVGNTYSIVHPNQTYGIATHLYSALRDCIKIVARLVLGSGPTI